MNHDSLKTEIKTAQTTTREQRAEATKLIHQGRSLRKQAKTETDEVKKARLNAEGWNCHHDGVYLRAEANYGRPERRHLHLAAALLNGRTYLQCEQKCEEKPSASMLGRLIAPFLSDIDKPNSDAIAKSWLTQEVRLSGLTAKLDEAA